MHEEQECSKQKVHAASNAAVTKNTNEMSFRMG